MLKISIHEKKQEKNSQRLQQLTDVSTGNRHDRSWMCENCRRREEEKWREKVKLYAEVEFSAQGYDTHTPSNQPTGRHGPWSLLSGVHVPPQDS